ncbi:MAG: HlyD family efflux transporter periplasmic adaptor subunit [Pseudomonadota bacterium]
MGLRKVIAAAAVMLALGAGGYVYWQKQIAGRLPAGIVTSNGRLEADQINVATKYAGRVREVMVDEGEMVDTGQVVAQMDDGELTAQFRRAGAEVRRAEQGKEEATASVLRARSQLEFAEAELKRVQRLHREGFATTEKTDQRYTELQAADAAYRAAVAGTQRAEEAISSAKEERGRLATILADMTLKAPKRGRVQYRLTEPGEVIAAGGRVVTLLDISDLHMTLFLPAADAGQLVVGSEARIVLDPVPQYVIPANVSFVAAEAQFTPKAVETAEERAKLVFRVKVRIKPELLRKYEDRAKSGVRGMAYLQLPGAEDWPERLQIKLPK